MAYVSGALPWRSNCWTMSATCRKAISNTRVCAPSRQPLWADPQMPRNCLDSRDKRHRRGQVTVRHRQAQEEKSPRDATLIPGTASTQCRESLKIPHPLRRAQRAGIAAFQPHHRGAASAPMMNSILTARVRKTTPCAHWHTERSDGQARAYPQAHREKRDVGTPKGLHCSHGE